MDSIREFMSPDVSLKKFTTFKCGGNAEFIFRPMDEAILLEGLSLFRRENLPWIILGEGSNVLLSDKGIRGVVILLNQGQFIKISQVSETLIEAGGGVRTRHLSRWAMNRCMSGFEFLIGFPGTVGGAVAGNAGDPMDSIGPKVHHVRGINGAQLSVGDLPYSYQYRTSNILPHMIITSVTFAADRLRKMEDISQDMTKILQRRKQSDPSGFSAGSIFKNTPALKAWQIIDQLGLRGYQSGGAMISPKHANWIINSGEGTSQDIYDLIQLVKKRAKAELDIDLETEIRIIGEFKK